MGLPYNAAAVPLRTTRTGLYEIMVPLFRTQDPSPRTGVRAGESLCALKPLRP
jgi:hypothetical protein